MLKDPGVLQQLARIGCVPIYQNASEARARVTREMEEINSLYGLK